MQTLTLSSKNQVVIPSNVRAKIGIKGGDRLVVKSITDKEVVLIKQPGYADFAGIAGVGKGDPVKRIRGERDAWRLSDLS